MINQTNIINTLSKRQYQIFKLIGEGYNNKEIAERLFVSIKTVENHKSSICKKLNLNGCKELYMLIGKIKFEK
ncbi:MAG: LuxR C-terminal-related transcriptional regulator [Melioribacteraceae bacterium]|nr:LuxR C-terminal-related transcriptional regulator [Melioribacteraceae bacterium]MCF8262995.1 LuxR C-terminal-related transcriptional regulator [Melioribacteraceae bacterium]MCF8430440.1 LuxR C-terminal-related transcriptional regulator [Melioribacteraceae bacterium]